MDEKWCAFTPEMGKRLRMLRLRAGLSQAEVAARMGRNYVGGNAYVGLLEAGKIADPHLSAIRLFLMACSAKASTVQHTVGSRQHTAYRDPPRVLCGCSRYAVSR